MGIARPLALLLVLSAAVESAASSQEAPDWSLESQVNHLLAPLVERDIASGAVLIARGDEVRVARGFGLANRDHRVDNTPQTPFRLASVSKSITAVAVLQLVDRGLVDLDAPLEEHLPDYPNGEKITVRQLLSHSSGIPSTSFVEGLHEKSLGDHTLEESIAWFRDEPLRFEPGSRFDYSNSGYVVLSHLIEVVSGLAYERYMNDHVFAPAKMENSGLDSRGRIVEGRATGYSRRSTGSIARAAYRNPRECYGCGALFSTVVDLFLFQRALVNGTLLSPAARDAMWVPVLDTPWGDKYGLGWFVGDHLGRRTVVGRGGTSGFMSVLQYFPDSQVLVAALLNQDFMLHGELFDRLAAIALGEPVSPLLAAPSGDSRTHPLATYLGEYLMEDGIWLRFCAEEEGFFLEEEGQPGRFEVLPLDLDAGFAAEPNARLNFRPATDDGPIRLDALYGVLLWRGERVAPCEMAAEAEPSSAKANGGHR